MKQTKFQNIYERGQRLFTLNLTPGQTFFEEETEKSEGKEYRQLDARRSKLGAGIVKGLSQVGVKPGDTVLYLGASHGYTVSYVSDIVGKDGFIFALDFAPRVVRDLVFLCEKRKNMTPIMADANQPHLYSHRIHSADFIFMDVAQKNQAEIFLKNCRLFLKKDGFGMLAVKSRSVDITRKPKQIYQEVRIQLEKELTVVDFKLLDPFEKDHCIFVVKKK
ncbi:TPA: fibrillarin-like rRNA/tRNA 2'-O-methyltransferase [Candidatus Woesearchaeota archaeon]|nr:Fibrillarin-like protein rRNA/tRNA 2'-O-methyltransferase [archaeon GW2011_AR15]MBS3103704.1 fibrillarin-like rRNA/tRNA 2'-O-methyltransferase [Candidatus Woesearchaeota archaeon]HIH40996.1 fibrillarin-like rRNA/tRNA 2'-O-methyltransferase [Candidatus Woesearchaeota archaeon]